MVNLMSSSHHTASRREWRLPPEEEVAVKAPRILVIEDDPVYRELMVQLLEAAKSEVFTAADGRAGVKQYQSLAPDLVITDLIMPVMDGIETIRLLLTLNPNIKIIAVSGGGSMQPGTLLRYAREFGALDGLEKPFSASEFMTKVKALLPPDRQDRGENPPSLANARARKPALSRPRAQPPLQNGQLSASG